MKHLFFGIALTAVLVATQARGDQWDKKTILTVSNQPIQIRDTVLQPGQYVLRLLDSQADRHVVQIFNRDQTHIINTVLAVPSMRVVPTGHTKFTFWETPPGTAKAMRDWYYPGDTVGQEFPYPKHLEQIAMLEPPAVTPPANTESESQSSTESTESQSSNNESSQAEETQPQPVNPEPEQQPAEVAQNAAPPPAESQPAQTTPAPAELPKTATEYPLIGLAGGVLLGLFLLLRRRLWA